MNSSKTPSPDGRIRRGARNRKQIVDAVLSLIANGNPKPTAQQVAATAGVGARTLFRHFCDMSELRKEVLARAQAIFKELNYQVDATGSCGERIIKITQARFAVYRHMAPYMRSGVLHRYDMHNDSGQLPGDFHYFSNQMLEDIRLWFAQEIAEHGEGLMLMIDTVLCFETWDRLQRLQHQSPETVEALTITSLERLLQVKA